MRFWLVNIHFAAGLLVLALGFSGCTGIARHLKPLDSAKSEEVAKRLLAELGRRREVHGSVTLRATGIRSLFSRLDVDLIAQQPSFLYLSIPSFFGQSARVMSCDGNTFYLLDYMQEGEPLYLTMQCLGNDLWDLLGLPLDSDDLVQTLLGTFNPSDADLDSIQFDEGRKEYVLTSRNSDRVTLLYFDAATATVRERRRLDAFGALVYEVFYKNFKEFDGVLFATEWLIRVKQSGEVEEFQIANKDLKYNEEVFQKEDFVIESPWAE